MALIYYVTQIQFEFGAVKLLKQECARIGITRPLLVTDPDGLTLVVPVHNAVLLLNVDATSDLDVVANAFFGSLQQLLPATIG